MTEQTKNTSPNCRTNLIKKKTFKIMIIDDDVNVSLTLKQYLEHRGHIVTIIEEGVRGLSQLHNNKYDLIFLDYHLDNNYDFDGVSITECIKNSDNKNVKIFAYTGDTSNEAIIKFKNVGMDGVVYKPVEIIVLDKIMSILETKNSIDLQGIIRKHRGAIVIF